MSEPISSWTNGNGSQGHALDGPLGYPERAPTGSEAPIPGRCGAKLAGSDPARYCRQWPLQDRTRCAIHGGHGLLGTQNPGFVHGLKSKHVPTKLAADYYAAKQDPHRLSLQHEIAFWTAREQELSKRLETIGEPGDAWPQVQTAWEAIHQAHLAIRQAQRRGDLSQLRQALDALGPAITKGRSAIKRAQHERWLYQCIQDAHEFLGRLRHQEHRRMMEIQQTWTSDQVSLRFGQFMRFLWEACTECLEAHQIRPFLTRFQQKMRSINAAWLETLDTPPHDE